MAETKKGKTAKCKSVRKHWQCYIATPTQSDSVQATKHHNYATALILLQITVL